ncbi:MAG: type restriction endonuclease subunit [Actinomycetia bacterium]|nr:type restriction endonuclease subunit [Actinomycetes bacterium]
MNIDERLFEDAIEAQLLEHGGYQKSAASSFDAVLGLDAAETLTFIGATQVKEWTSLLARYGNDADRAQRGFAKRLAAEIDSRGTVDVLRHGLVDLGITIRLAYFKPAHGLTSELLALYEANRVTVTRQVRYEVPSTNTLDLMLLVNGIPTATAELKNKLTNQTIEHAIGQYRSDRDPGNVTLSRRALVHFAVDPDRVAMTTKLAGQQTKFLPFNLGDDGRAGNPPNPQGHRTSYLWERVWTKDAWMDLLARFIHVERPTKGSPAAKKAAEVIVFPRFHQWDAVLAVEADAKFKGPGQNYLIEHSAGSGKSNTIAWTAHRLSNLHDTTDTKVFDKVVVITDRVILDRQLQETIYQFEHTRGVVVKIDKDSAQLAEALAGEQARIIITTLQKFPFVLDKIGGLPGRRYAVIVDEAHSSQTGEAAKDLRLALGATEEVELTVAEAEDLGFVAVAVDPVEEALGKAVGARGKQANLSFFAFTATPKARTLEMFGTWDDAQGRYRPFHLYKMRQAIEEGFILDVLKNYTTYQTFWRIEKAVTEDPTYEAAKAQRAIARFVSLHPHNLAQKAEIIVEHFRAHTAEKIGGNAKAMVVTSSRLHAVRYKQAIDVYIVSKKYEGLAALVAFSGKVIDESGFTYTETGMNGLPEAQTADRFDTQEYQVLIVAEKFQTGFDQPFLHTMYVDKVLVGLAAVQTLSRLNRMHPLKSDTFVLDFRNDAEEIVKAFEPYYGETVAPPTDPNLLWDTRSRLDQFDVLRPEEIEATVALLLTITGRKDHGRVYALLDPALERFKALGEEDRLEFKDALDKFVRTYSFLSQVVSFGDSKLERDYVFCRALSSRLRDETTTERLDLGGEVELTHLRSEITFEGSLALTSDAAEVSSVFGDGAGCRNEPEVEHLSQIVEALNERFGLKLDESDQLLFDQFEETWITDPVLADQARNNTIENFRLVFERMFLNTVVGRMDDNEAIFKRILDDEEFQALIREHYMNRVYATLREDRS